MDATGASWQAGMTMRDSIMALARRWAALPETAMRTAALAQHLAQVGDARGIWVLEWLIRGVRCGDPGSLAVYTGMVIPSGLAQALGQARIDGLRQAAAAAAAAASESPAAQTLVVRFWLAPEPMGDDHGVNPLALVHRDLRKLTLGDRRALARKARGEALKRLLCDPDPGVITHVLNNPHTTEETVLAVCSRRPTVAAPLVCVLQHGRWNRRYRVRTALVHNPALPQALAVNLLVFLRDPDLLAVHDNGTMRPMLRQAAERLLHIRGDRDAIAHGA